MTDSSRRSSALISVFYKDGLEPLIRQLHAAGHSFLSTGGTRKHIEELGYTVDAVEDLTGYPSILGGRVKTLHPKVFGGILARREQEGDDRDVLEYDIPSIDVVVVDLYPFEETLSQGASHQDIIEKIDIGGISLIRATAKNYQDTWIIPSRAYYAEAIAILENGGADENDRKRFAAAAFEITSDYDHAIHQYLMDGAPAMSLKLGQRKTLRYGENPHQDGSFYGDLEEVFEQLHGRELSYNNLLDADAAVNLIREFDDCTVAILKHNNACGLASRNSLKEAWTDALAGDPVSAFGGVIITNRKLDKATAEKMQGIFSEIVIAPAYEAEALAVLQQKKNRIILMLKDFEQPQRQYRSLLNGFLVQDRDDKTDSKGGMEVKTTAKPSDNEYEDLVFASKICKHTKSNTIVLAKNRQLFASGTGQTSRVDALNQAITKAKSFKFDLEGSVMASDAFFPFPDCVEIAHGVGISSVIQPGGSIKDQLSIDFCNDHKMSMVFTGTRHFKH